MARALGLDADAGARARAVDRRRVRCQGWCVPGAARGRGPRAQGSVAPSAGPRPGSENLLGMTHGRGTGARRRARRDARRHVHRSARARVRRRRRVPDPRDVHPDGHAHDVVGCVRDPQDRLRRHAGGHQHHADRPVPRRGKAGSRGAGGAGRRHDGTRARRRSRRSAAAQLPARLRVPVHDRRPAPPTTAASTRSRSTRPSALADYDRLARRADAPRRADADRATARHRARLLRGDVGPRR